MIEVRTLLLAVILAGGGATGCSSDGDAVSADGRLRSALVGGTVDANTTGVLALFLAARGQWLFECTGALVAPNVVLSAAHCVLAFDPDATTRAAACEGNSGLRLAAPESILAVSGERADQTVHGVARIVIPAISEDRVPDLCGQDIALLVLKEPIPKSVAEPLVLRLSRAASSGDTIDSVGFGADDAWALPVENVRRRATGSVRCVAAECELDDVRDGEWLSEDIFACSGDSGGPALDQAGKVVGVVSRGFRDCHSIIYEDVYASRDFLERELSAASATARTDDVDESASATAGERAPSGCALGITGDWQRRAPRSSPWAGAGLAMAVIFRRLRRVRSGAR